MIRSDTMASDPAIGIRDQRLGPCFLFPFAEDLARRLARVKMGPLLEIGADTGVLTQATALVMPADWPMTVGSVRARAKIAGISNMPTFAAALWS